MSENIEQQFSIKRIYLKDASFETPAGIEAFAKKWEPQVQLDVNTRTSAVAENAHEVVLSLTLTATVEDKSMLLIEVQQAGIFEVKGLEGDQLRHVLSTMCPDILFPYARETVDALAQRGSFPVFMLAPINFDALFKQALQQAEAKESEKH